MLWPFCQSACTSISDVFIETDAFPCRGPDGGRDPGRGGADQRGRAGAPHGAPAGLSLILIPFPRDATPTRMPSSSFKPSLFLYFFIFTFFFSFLPLERQFLFVEL